LISFFTIWLAVQATGFKFVTADANGNGGECPIRFKLMHVPTDKLHFCKEVTRRPAEFPSGKPPTQAEGQAGADKLNELLDALKRL
jgi:hypothetical protein